MTEMSAHEQIRANQEQDKSKAINFKTMGLAIIAMLGLLYWLMTGHVIHVTPATAQANTSISVSQGVGVSVGDTIYRLTDIEIQVGADKYISQTIDISNSSAPNIYVELVPAPARLTVQISGQNLDQTKWYIDDQPVAKGASLSTELQPGEYVVKIDNPFYKVVEETLKVGSGDHLELSYSLEKVLGSIKINSLPQGAKVSINNNFVGTTPLHYTDASGSLDISVSLPDHATSTEVVDIVNQQPHVKRNYKLVRNPAHLSISAKPSDGTLIVDGRKQSLGDIQVASRKSINIGYDKPGYKEYKQQLTLNPGERKKLTIELQPDFGSVVLLSQPAADIFINGQPVGHGKLTKTLSAIPHQLEFSKVGYRTVKKTLTPTSEKETVLQVKLMKEYDARRLEGKPTVAQSLGIELLKFRPTSFKLGSEGNERGRKRNEFLIPVSFNKKFYVSRHEITEAQFAQFKGSRSTSKKPVTNVSWLEAVNFCNWLSKAEGLAPFYTVKGRKVTVNQPVTNGYRLPTEAEWEWLAKRANRALATKYIWGESETIPEKVGNLGGGYDDGFAGAAPVGSFKANNRTGLYDLEGNVSEWVHDYNTLVLPKTGNQSMVDYLGPERGEEHVAKGGNYDTAQLSELRSAYKQVLSGGKPTIGFRISRYE